MRSGGSAALGDVSATAGGGGAESSGRVTIPYTPFALNHAFMRFQPSAADFGS